MIEETDLLKDITLVENNAKTIRDHLKELDNNPKNHQRRWFWELLQNAKDSALENQSIKIRLELKGSILKFSHDGRPFKIQELIHIIFHGSTKDQLEGKTGKFGTGFMTTHLLSKVIDIEGKIEDGRYINFRLDRSSKDVKILKIALDDSYTAFKDDLKRNVIKDLGQYQTFFTYHLNEKTKKIAEDGIAELKIIAAKVLAFNDNIDSIEVLENEKSWKIAASERTVLFDGNISQVSFLINETPVQNTSLIYKLDADLHLGVEYNPETKEINRLDKTVPRIFLDFPLFGSENIGIPLIINSKNFHPLRERTGIYLNAVDEEDNNEEENEGVEAHSNRLQLTKAVEAIKKLVSVLAENGVKNLHHLFNFRKPVPADWIDEEFLAKLYAKTLKDLFDVKVEPVSIETKITLNKSLNELYLPSTGKEDESNISNVYYDLLSEIIPDLLPGKSTWPYWKKYRKTWGTISPDFKEVLKFDFTTSKLLSHIAGLSSAASLGTLYFNSDSDVMYNWLDRFYAGLIKNDEVQLLKEYNCVPNQKLDLVKLDPNNLFIDKIKNEDLKLIGELIDLQIKKQLVHEQITSIANQLTAVDLMEFTQKVITRVTEKKVEFGMLPDASKNPLIQMTEWCFVNDKVSLLSIPFIFSNSNDDQPKIEVKLLSESEKALVPPKYWPQELFSYVNLISGKFLLSNIYDQLLGEERIDFLHSKDLVYKSPLIVEDQAFKREEINMIMTQESQTKLNSDEPYEITQTHYRVSKLVWFESGDDNSVLKRVKDSKKKTRFLIEFLLKHLIHFDQSWKEAIQLESDSEIKIAIHPSLWLCRLFSNAWIAMGTGRVTERPDVQNLSPYIKELNMLDNLLNPNVIRFLGVLKISVTDIIKKIKYDSEEKQNEWETAIISILHSDIEPKLAVELIKSPEVREFYKNRLAEQEFINNNQNIGKLFEALFHKLLLDKEYKDQGIYIERVHVGRDFDIIVEHDVLDEKREALLFEINTGRKKIYLELKATKGADVGMTPKQVEAAIKQQEEGSKYCLVVFPYNSIADITEENLLSNTKFVTDIAKNLADPLKSKIQLDNMVSSGLTRKEVAIFCRYEKVRFLVNKDIWDTDCHFSDFLDWLLLP
ncbi:ATP-binding protein [Mucilaginibacter sp. UYCu711]|uniref:ATP-binding protein n=1 Tax=Mucilaginibacter sp. UYCu711 TaxID=3156339 RepID=UPI003D25FCDA